MKKVIFCAVLGIVWTRGAVQAQEYERLPPPQEAADVPALPHPETGLSSWITYQRDNCCFGNVGADPAVGTEFFLRIGPSIPVGGNFLARILETGWTVEGGGRALFFNQPMDAAWFVEASLSNSHNHSSRRVLIPIRGEKNRLAVQSYNRTFVNLGLGREWYLYPATNRSRNWRFGVDAGGRYGSGSMGFYDSGHRTDAIGGIYWAAHTDLEFPFCCCHNDCVFVTGFRFEHGFTWSDILTRHSDLSDLNLLFNFGIRY